ncbi:hypothetical protein N7540_012497 [Penicillium herquei]|nr:hypothetical protein N7540_012497 [Penicillium herquei]
MAFQDSASLSAETLLDMLLPGFRPFSHLFLSYYPRIDLSAYSFHILLFISFWTFIAFVLPGIFYRARGCCMRYATSVDIMFQDELYSQTLHWISKHHSEKTTRLIAGMKTSYNSPWRQEDTSDMEYDPEAMSKWEESQPAFDAGQSKQKYWQELRYLSGGRSVQFTPAKDELHSFWHNGCLFAFRRNSTANKDSMFSFMENITFYTAPWNKWLLRGLVEDIQQEAFHQASKGVTIYQATNNDGNCRWVPVTSNSGRPIKSVILDKKQKESFMQDMEKFLLPTTREWYKKHHFTYQRGYLFSGPPGTGKSSLCLAAATHFCLPIYRISINSLDETSLSLLFQNLPKRGCIVLFEDIDVAGLPKRDHSSVPRRHSSSFQADIVSGKGIITLASLLNVLSGVDTTGNRIIVMTTNQTEALDKALVRPGRVDKEIKFEYASKFVLKSLFRDFYNGHCHDINTLSAIFAENVPDGTFTQAEIQNYLLRYREDPEAAVMNGDCWVKEIRLNNDCPEISG